MHRGTTPTVVIRLNTYINLNDLASCWVTFTSRVDSKELSFGMENLVLDDEIQTIRVLLSQEDTVFFTEGLVNVQVRLKTNDGLAYVSRIKTITLEPILKDGVI